LAALTRWKEPAIYIGQKVRWAPEPVWMLWSREKSLAPAVIICNNFFILVYFITKFLFSFALQNFRFALLLKEKHHVFD
jgi:hypothetical protein